MKSLVRKGMEVLYSNALTSKKFKQRNGEVVVLMYHGVVDVDPILPDWCILRKEQFEKQIKFLTENFNVIPLLEAVEGIKNDVITGPTAVITFDDGYQNNHDIAFPILEKYRAPASIFVSTKFIDTEDTLWTGVLQNAFGKTTLTSMEWKGQNLDLSTTMNKKKSMEFIKSKLKEENYSVIEKNTNEIVDVLSEGEGFRIDASSPYRMLTSAQIEIMAKSELIDFGAHTHNHPILSGLSREDQKFEIEHSIECVTQMTDSSCKSFAYPNGGEADFTDETMGLLEEAEMAVSLSTKLGLCRKGTPLMAYKRFGIGDETDFKRGLYKMYKMSSQF